jgi:hypothetical protein
MSVSEAESAQAAAADAAPVELQKPSSAKYWHDRLEEYKRDVEEKWSSQRGNLDKLYVRERSESADREYAIFWANIEILKESSYSRPPVPVVAPRFKQSNPLASQASDVLERSLVTAFEQADIDGCMLEVRDELLRYARGSARVRLGDEKVEFDHFTASDFAHDPARTWREVNWVAFRAWLDPEPLEQRFGEIMKAKGLDVKSVPKKKREGVSEGDKKADQVPVWEIWCRRTNKVHFVCEDYEWELDTQDPWLSLSGFWPCPRPAFGTVVPGKLRPVPDILQYKDQIEEINEYTSRIAALSQSLKVKGFYPAGAGELSDAIEAALKALDNRAILVPVSSAAALGGTSFKEAIVWLPVKEIAEIITTLVELRRVVIEDVYQIMGISDIVRGDSDPDETLGAQQIKSQWGSVRIRGKQKELIRFARDLTRIAAEIMSENFKPETLQAMSQVQLPTQQQKQAAQMQMLQQQGQMGDQPPQPVPPEIEQMLKSPSLEEVVGFLRDDKARGFVIEIETDSTIQPDEDAEKQRRTEFVTAIGGLIKEAGPMIMQAPQLGPFIGEVLKFTAQGFRAGRPLEGAIDTLVQGLNQAAQQAMQPQEQPPDPVQEAKAAAADAQAKAAAAKGEASTVQAHASMAKTDMEMRAATLDHNITMEELAARAAMPQQPPGRTQ